MATPDMDVIKEIPGYKVILKAILKSQIQQLVEQLASTTDEESVILTANISDGTLSHLGSDSGKYFLEDHEDIKSQFLGFCLKRQHRMRQEKEREEAAQREEALKREEALRMSQMQPRFMPQRSPRMQRGGVHPVHLMRASPGSGIRGAMRHEPYPTIRPKRTSLSFDGQQGQQGQATPPKQTIVKTEPGIENDGSGDAETSSHTPSHPKSENEGDDDAKSNSSSATNPESKFGDAQPPGGLGLDSDLSNLISGDNSQHSDSNGASETDTARKVKTEAMSDSEMELEITGVEPGRPVVPQENWAPNTPGGFDQSGASGSGADMMGNSTLDSDFQKLMGAPGAFEYINGGQQPRADGNTDSPECPECGKQFQSQYTLKRHMAIHYGERLQCDLCSYRTVRKDNLKLHVWTVHLNPSGKK